MDNPVLELKHIQKSYPSGEERLAVLKDVNLSISKGEIVGLIAPSGSGKSTLLHITGLLDRAETGQVIMSGVDATRLSDDERTAMRCHKIGFVYQFHHLLPEFSARENIILPQRAANIPLDKAKSRADDLLQMVGLSKRADHRPSELSGGEQQRVAIARALANQPDLLLADEPTGNLDPATSETVFQALLEIVRETGLSALIATHNIELAHRMDRVIRLEGGEIR